MATGLPAVAARSNQSAASASFGSTPLPWKAQDAVIDLRGRVAAPGGAAHPEGALSRIVQPGLGFKIGQGERILRFRIVQLGRFFQQLAPSPR